MARTYDTLSVMTDEKASTPLSGDAPVQGSALRLAADEHPLHTVEHAAQIRQFITTAR
jgi:hypothetical protein